MTKCGLKQPRSKAERMSIIESLGPVDFIEYAHRTNFWKKGGKK